MTRLARIIDTTRCIGCRTCVATCAVENHFTPDRPWYALVEYEVGTFPDVSRVYNPIGCMHCESPPCKAVCDQLGYKAITRNDYGVVLVDYDRCKGCGECNPTCPYAVPQISRDVEPLFPGKGAYGAETVPAAQRHPTHRKHAMTVEKCTFCWHKLEPAIAQGKQARLGVDREYTPSCDLACPVQARTFGDLDDPDSPVARKMAGSRPVQLKTRFGTAPRVYYVLAKGARS